MLCYVISTTFPCTAGDGRADMRACLWKLPFEDGNEELLDDGSVKDLIKVTDLGTETHGDMK